MCQLLKAVECVVHSDNTKKMNKWRERAIEIGFRFSNDGYELGYWPFTFENGISLDNINYETEKKMIIYCFRSETKLEIMKSKVNLMKYIINKSIGFGI